MFLCFNRHLAHWLEEQVRKEPRLRGREQNLEIANFHAFAFRLAKRASVEFDLSAQLDSAFWDEEAPLIMEQAIEVLKDLVKPAAL